MSDKFLLLIFPIKKNCKTSVLIIFTKNYSKNVITYNWVIIPCFNNLTSTHKAYFWGDPRNTKLCNFIIHIKTFFINQVVKSLLYRIIDSGINLYPYSLCSMILKIVRVNSFSEKHIKYILNVSFESSVLKKIPPTCFEFVWIYGRRFVFLLYCDSRSWANNIR